MSPSCELSADCLSLSGCRGCCRHVGTDMDAIDFDLERNQRKQRAPQRRHFGPEVAKGHISGSAAQVT